MSRRFQRVRVRLTATVVVVGEEKLVACPTRDLSEQGCFLDTAEPLAVGASLGIAVMDNFRGEVVEVEGEVARQVEPDPDGLGGGVGVLIPEPSAEWTALVERLRAESGPVGADSRSVRLRVLVVGDTNRRRSALALYVTSGWDVRFASDEAGAVEALQGVQLDAVIAELELEDARWPTILNAARDIQPQARRIVRCALRGQPTPQTDPRADLVHRVVDLDAGLEALFDSLTAEM